jgi:hypothetical protein
MLVSLHTDLLAKMEFQVIALVKLKLQGMTAENLSLARVPRMNRNKLEHIEHAGECTTENNLCHTWKSFQH